MPYELPDDASLEWLDDYVVGVEAALEALPETAPAAAAWGALYEEIRAARDARDQDRRAHKKASARTRVLDKQWDRAVVGVSSEAFHLAGKKADAAPYSLLFGAMKAKDVTSLGPHKATVFGGTLLEKAKAATQESLKKCLDLFRTAQDALAAASAANIAARQKAAGHDAARRLLFDKAEALIPRTEVAVLTALPGRRDLLDAALALPGRNDDGGRDVPTPEPDPEA